MVVQSTDISRERRGISQDDGGSGAKRFKPASSNMEAPPSHKVKPTSSVGDSGLKIRISRYNAAPGRSQQKQDNLPQDVLAEADTPPSETPSSGTTPSDTPSSDTPAADTPAGVRTRGSPRTTRRPRRGSSSESLLEPLLRPVKQDLEEILKTCEVRLNPLKPDSDNPDLKPNLKIEMTSSEIISECERVGPGSGAVSTSVYDQQPAPEPIKRENLPNIRKENLQPDTPCVYITSKKEAFSPQLMEWCLQKPISMIRGITKVCGIDLGLFTTKTLVNMHPNHPLEVRTQLEQSSDENWDPSLQDQVWYCTSSRSHTTVVKYAEYHTQTFIEAKEKLGDKFSVNPPLELKTDPDTGLPERKQIKFGTNCDLSDEKKWEPQLTELKKLPSWMSLTSPKNMLSHIGHQILGMNTAQLYIKVPCSRTPGHQENNNFIGANINVGPGNSEWFGVPNEYWGALQELCVKKKVDYLHGSWWPLMSDLMEADIPCFRFMQGPGDMVWVNSGCVHWVQASGWCTNVAWNVGPLSSRCYNMAIERYEWNKTQRYQSVVAMVYLTWNLAKNLDVLDSALFCAMKRTLLSSIRTSVLKKLYAKKCNIPVKFHGHKDGEPVNYCMVCEEEVFNVFFVRESDKRHVVHCLRCAKELSTNLEGWICLEEYAMEDLQSTYDSFVLGGFKKEEDIKKEIEYKMETIGELCYNKNNNNDMVKQERVLEPAIKTEQ